MSITNRQAYPLCWPPAWPKMAVKEKSAFKTTLSAALHNLKLEVERLGGKNLILSSNVTLGSEYPKEPGVCAYFDLREQHIAIPCDRWNKVQDNVRAIALTIEAMRGMERWGAKHMITALFTGFNALPEKTGESCWEILGVPAGATEKAIKDAYRARAMETHPDKPGGSAEAFGRVQAAYNLAVQNAGGLT